MEVYLTSYRLKAAINNIEDDPINVIHTAQEEYERAAGGFRQRQREILASAYAFAMHVRDKPDLIASFYAEPFFSEKKRRPKRKAILRMAICFALGGLSGPEYRRAMALAYAVQPDFDADRSAEEVAKDLRELGVFKLRERRLPGKRKARPARPLDEIDNGALRKGIDSDELDGHGDFHEAEGPFGEEEEDEDESDEEQVNEEQPDEEQSKVQKQPTKKEQAQYDLRSAVKEMWDGWDGSPILLLEAGHHLDFASPLKPQLGRSGTIRYSRKRASKKFVHIGIEALEPDD